MSRSINKAAMSPLKSDESVAPAPAPVAKRTTRSTNNDADDAAAPASKRQRKDGPAAVEEAAEQRLHVEAPRQSPSPTGDASRPAKKIAKTKENIRTMIAYGKGKGKAKAAAPTNPEEEDAAASATIQAENTTAEAPKPRGRKPLPSVSSPKFPSPTPKEPPMNLKTARDVAGDDLADAALESVADKNKENFAMRGKNAAGRQAGRKNFIDPQADAEKVSQIADFEEEKDQQLRREAESKSAKETGDEESDDISQIEGQPEVVSLAGVKRRGRPLTRDVQREESVDADQHAAREAYNAQLKKEKAARDAEREHEREREEMRRKKGGPGQQGQQAQQAQQVQQVQQAPQAQQAVMVAPRPLEGDEAAPSPSFSDMKKVAKEKAALHRQQRGSIKPRKPWTADEEDTFARLIELHGCNWAQLERTDEMKAFGGRTQSQLKDKAMNMKALIMKAEAPLPKNFQFISLRATQKEDIRSLGIDPDNYPY